MKEIDVNEHKSSDDVAVNTYNASPEEIILTAEIIAVLFGHVAARTARRLAPAIDHLASEPFADDLRAAGQAVTRHAELRARHRREIAAEHGWER